jgi:hypothetical protein
VHLWPCPHPHRCHSEYKPCKQRCHETAGKFACDRVPVALPLVPEATTKDDVVIDVRSKQLRGNHPAQSSFGDEQADDMGGDDEDELLWSVAKLINWLIDWLIDWLINWFIYWLIDKLIDWLIDWLICWLINWLVDWLIDWLIDWLTDWLIHLKEGLTRWGLVCLLQQRVNRTPNLRRQEGNTTNSRECRQQCEKNWYWYWCGFELIHLMVGCLRSFKESLISQH